MAEVPRPTIAKANVVHVSRVSLVKNVSNGLVYTLPNGIRIGREFLEFISTSRFIERVNARVLLIPVVKDLTKLFALLLDCRCIPEAREEHILSLIGKSWLIEAIKCKPLIVYACTKTIKATAQHVSLLTATLRSAEFRTGKPSLKRRHLILKKTNLVFNALPSADQTNIFKAMLCILEVVINNTNSFDLVLGQVFNFLDAFFINVTQPVTISVVAARNAPS